MPQINCPINDGSTTSCPWQPRKGHVRDAPNVGLKECENCGLVTSNKDLSEIVNYEEGSMHNWASRYEELTLEKVQSDIVRRVTLIRQLSETFRSKSLLDFGCGNGEMLSAIEEAVPVFGIEPDREARNKCTSHGHQVWESADHALNANIRFDIVTLFHVVEHFYDPVKELKLIRSLLQPGGLLVIETPSADDALLTKYDSEYFQNFTYWSHHPMLHSKKSLEALLIKSGFQIAESRGVQRYGLANHLYWLSQGKPGGHKIWSELFSQASDLSYESDLAEAGFADTLWVVGKV